MAHGHDHHDEHEIAPAQTTEIWKTFWILLVITAFEFAIAFMVPHHMKWTRVGIFVVMTIVKAGFIVGNFMHLRHEVKSMIYTILLPTVFVVWLLIALIYEGGALYLFDRGV